MLLICLLVTRFWMGCKCVQSRITLVMIVPNLAAFVFAAYINPRSFIASAMATNRCANRPPKSSQPGLNRGTPNPQSNTAPGAPNPTQQGPQHVYPGMYTSQDYQPGPPCTPHPHFPPHPFMYMPPATHPHPQPPPMPPFHQYQWPMPYSYNPFSGFPGMGEWIV